MNPPIHGRSLRTKKPSAKAPTVRGSKPLRYTEAPGGYLTGLCKNVLDFCVTCLRNVLLITCCLLLVYSLSSKFFLSVSFFAEFLAEI